MNKKYREESINEFRESKKEYDKVRAEGKMYYDKEVSEYREMMNEGINELKNTMKEAKEGVTEMKDILKRVLKNIRRIIRRGKSDTAKNRKDVYFTNIREQGDLFSLQSVYRIII